MTATAKQATPANVGVHTPFDKDAGSGGGWTAFRSPRGPFARRRHGCSTHSTAAAAAAAILGSRFSQAHGTGSLSDVRWTEAASLLAREIAGQP